MKEQAPTGLTAPHHLITRPGMVKLYLAGKLALLGFCLVVVYQCLNVNKALLKTQVEVKGCKNVPYDPFTISGISVESFRPEVSTWKYSCIPLKFSRSLKFPLTALASYPGSGNTWSRHLIQQVTGIYVGSVYSDLLVSGDRQPTDFSHWKDLLWNGSCVAVKTHQSPSALPKPNRYDKAIVVIRNPTHSLVAEFKRLHWNVAKNVLNAEDIFSDGHFQKFFSGQAKSWLEFNKQWLSADLCILVLQYEHLQSDLYFQLLRVAHFLGIDTSRLDPSHFKCIVGNTGGKLKWPRSTPPASLYTSDMNATLEAYKAEIRQLLHGRHGITDISF